MAEEETNKLPAYPMKKGDDIHSYAKNSNIQRTAIEVAKEAMTEAILEKNMSLSSSTFTLADLGCSYGPNTFIAVKNIIEAVKLNYHNQGLSSKIPEFQVFFNDHASNDFNALFTSLPQDNKQYFAAGVPGSFYGRLFPKASLNFVHSSYAIHWLSRVPKEVMNKNSLAWNKARVHYTNFTDEVFRAYKSQYVMDMDKFFQARAQEIVFGGLMSLIILGRPNGTTQSLSDLYLDLLGCCFVDLVNKGIVSDEKVDSFNVPVYIMSPQELQEAVEKNGCFNIEKMENFPCLVPEPSQVCSLIRAVLEELIKQHFGEQIIEVLFNLYQNKLEQVIPYVSPSIKDINIFVLLQRKATDNN